ncbi:YadA-like family protein [Cupriavidus nantongensis]|nr:YadA-like family protein [Cupriavidus nantongensis]
MRGAGSGVSGARNVAMGSGDGNVAYDGTVDAAAGSLVTGNDNVAIGTNAGIGVTANSTTSIGYNAMATGMNATALGAGAAASGLNSVYLGARTMPGSGAIAQGAIGVGTDVTASQTDAIAMGRQSQASGVSAIAMGTMAVADTADAVAIGNGSTATGGKAVSIGSGNFASGNGAVAIGDPNTATGDGAVAQGMDNTATGNGSVALGNTNMVGGGGQAVSTAGTAAQGAVGIGYQNTVVGQGSVAIGSTSRALGAGAVAFGDSAVANNARDVALGSGSVSAAPVPTANTVIRGTTYTFAGANPTSVVSVGAAGAERQIQNVAAGRISNTSTDAINGSQLYAVQQSLQSAVAGASAHYYSVNDNGTIGANYNNDGASGRFSVAAGVGATAAGIQGTAVGYLANASGLESTAIGYASTASAVNATAIGNQVIAAASGSIAIGTNNTALPHVDAASTNGISVGFWSTVNNAPSGIAVGDRAAATAANAMAMGSSAAAAGEGSTALGYQSNATGYYATAAGVSSRAAGQNAVGLGYDANAAGGWSVAAGSSADATGAFAVAIGQSANATGTQGIALGNGAAATGTNGSIAVGGSAQSSAVNAMAFGTGATASQAGSVALGSGSTTAAAVGTPGAIIGGNSYTFAGTTPASTVSVGAAGAERTITNVAAGRLSGTSTDAVNGSQLYATNTQVDQNTTNIATNTSNIANLDSQLTNINNGAGIKYFHANSALPDSQALGTDSVAIGPNAVANNAGDIALGSGSSTAAAVGTAGETIGGTAYTFAGATPASTVSVGAAGAERTLTNVAAGRLSGTSTDAVNGSQLFATNSKVNQNTTDIANLSTTVGDINNGAGIKYFHANSTLPDSQALGTNSVAIGPNAVANNAGDIALGSGSTTAAAVGTAGETIGGTAYTFAGATPASTVSVGAAGAERTITNVAAGRLSATSTDAVNGSQLFATNSKVNQNTTDIANLSTTVGDINNGAGIKYFHANSTLPDSQALGTDSVAIGPNAVANNAGDIALGAGSTTAAAVGTPGATVGGNAYTFAGTTPASTLSVGAPGAERTITNVAAGRLSGTSTDAVNGSQLYATNTQVDQNTTNIATNTTNIANLSTTIGDINNGAGIKYFHANSSLPDSQALGTDSVAIGPNAVANNAGDIALGAGSVTAAAVGTGGITLAGNAYTFAGANPASTLSIGAVGAERTITNVAAGRLSATSTDAINGSQLHATNQAIGQVAQQAGATNERAVKYDWNDANGNGQIDPGEVNYNSATLAGAGGTTISNLADGAVSATSTEAINGSQLYAVSSSITNHLGGGAVVNPDGTITGPVYNIQGGSYTTVSDAFNAVNGSITNINTAIDNISNGGGIKYFHANSTLPDSQALGTDSIAVGPAAVANNANSIAMGNNAVAGVDGGVALGAGSVSNRALAPATGNIVAGTGLVPYNTSDVTLLGAVSVGNAATNSLRQITNVADGTEAHDAVTIRQLQGAIGSVSATGTRYFHANSIAADSLAAGQESIAVGPTTVVNGDNGIGIGNGALVEMTAPGGTAIGQNALVSQADGVALGTNAQSQGIQSLALGAGSQALFANSVALGAGSVTTVGARTGYVGYGLGGGQNSVGEVSVGTAAGQRQITNVAAGSAPTDAVNVSQLNQVAQNTASSLGGGASYDPNTGSYTAPTYAVGGGTYNNVGDALAAQNTIVTNQGSSLANHLGGGTTYDPSTGNLGGGFTVNGKTYANVADAIGDTAGQVSNSIQYDNSDRSQITLGGTNGTKVTNVAAGNVSENSTDAVNGSQLHATNTTVNNLVEGKVGIVKQENSSAPITVGGDTGGTSISVAGRDGDRQITGVAEGRAPTDAVNVSQLNRVSEGIDQKLAGMDSRVRATENRSNAGIASAMAMASLPQAYLPSKSMLAIGTATFNGETGYALGLSRVSENGSWVMKASGAATSRGDYGGAVGMGYQW